MTPSVSVVIVPGNQRERAARSLASVLDQDGIERAEVVLLDAANDGSPPLPRSDEAPVRVFARPERGTYGELRAEGARLARAPIVAFLEEHAIGLPGWLAAIEESLASGEYSGAGGEVHPLNPGVGISDAVALMNYARWLPPLEQRGPRRSSSDTTPRTGATSCSPSGTSSSTCSPARSSCSGSSGRAAVRS